MKWDDIKVFIAVAEAGSTLAASKALGVNQTTVSRRIDALESATGLALFHRDLAGYRLTTTGRELLAVSLPTRPIFQKILAKADDLGRRNAEHIRLTGPAETINHWVYPILNRFRHKHPDLVMEVDTSETQVDLHSGEFDVAVRLADEIEDESLVARRIAAVPWGVYCSRIYEARSGAPRSIEDAQNHNIVHYADRVASRIQPIRWFGQHIDEKQITLRVSSVPGMVTALKSEDAIGVLPKVVGDSTSELVPCFRNGELKHNCWVVASPEAYARPLVRACMKQIADEFPRDSL
ncbi:MAG: LysR substrate-binding domain-containing protein [Pelagibaca sp.]